MKIRRIIANAFRSATVCAGLILSARPLAAEAPPDTSLLTQPPSARNEPDLLDRRVAEGAEELQQFSATSATLR